MCQSHSELSNLHTDSIYNNKYVFCGQKTSQRQCQEILSINILINIQSVRLYLCFMWNEQ